jgi:hypothetical protein
VDLNGQVVEVQSAQNVVNGVLLADSIEVKNVGVTDAPGEAIELQGIITRVLASCWIDRPSVLSRASSDFPVLAHSILSRFATQAHHNAAGHPPIFVTRPNLTALYV